MPPAAVCITMGPSLNDVDLLSSLLEAGATCARIDLTVSPPCSAVEACL
jgi:hypothetical protein